MTEVSFFVSLSSLENLVFVNKARFNLTFNFFYSIFDQCQIMVS